MRVLLTGGAGFIGSHVAERILASTDWRVAFLDRLDFSGSLSRIADAVPGPERGRCSWHHHDLRAPLGAKLIRELGDVGAVLHLAASTHVDRSIEDPLGAVMDNVVGTCNLLEYCRAVEPPSVLYFSTDEVFGPAPKGTAYKEWDRYKSGNPYAASKAGAEELVLAYCNTYGVRAYITHTMNVFGPRQHPEKYVPGCIRKVLAGDVVTVHADAARKVPGSRYYVHAQSVADAVLFLLPRAAVGDKYNIVGSKEVDNLELARMVADSLGRPLRCELVSFHASRPGHDLRYALDGGKLARMGWTPPDTLEDSLSSTVEWYLDHKEWL